MTRLLALGLVPDEGRLLTRLNIDNPSRFYRGVQRQQRAGGSNLPSGRAQQGYKASPTNSGPWDNLPKLKLQSCIKRFQPMP